MKTIVRFIALSFALSILTSLSAQKSHFTFNAGWSYPIGKFAHSDIEVNEWALLNKCPDAGAGQGTVLGVQWRKPVRDKDGYSYLLSLDFFYNGLNSDIKSNVFRTRQLMETNFSEVAFVQPAYINLPLMLGICYEWTRPKGLSFFVEAQMGANFFIITDRSVTLRGGKDPIDIMGLPCYDYVYTDHFDNNFSEAFKLGVGLRFSNRWQLNLDILWLGRHLVKGTENYQFITGPNKDKEVKGQQDFMLGEVTPLFISTSLGFRL